MVRTDCTPTDGFLFSLAVLITTFLCLLLVNYGYLRSFFEECFGHSSNISKSTPRKLVSLVSSEIARIKIARAVTGVSWMLMCLLFIPMITVQTHWIDNPLWFYCLMFAQSLAFCGGTVSLTLFQLMKLIETFENTTLQLSHFSVIFYHIAAGIEMIGILTFVIINALFNSNESRMILLSSAMITIVAFQGSFIAMTLQFGLRLMKILTQSSVDPTSPHFGMVTQPTVNKNRKLSVRDFESSQRPILRASARETLLSAWITIGTLGIGTASVIFALNDCFNIAGTLATGVLFPLSWLDICVCALYLGNNYNGRRAYGYWCEGCDRCCSRSAAKLTVYMQTMKITEQRKKKNSWTVHNSNNKEMVKEKHPVPQTSASIDSIAANSSVSP